MVFFWRRLRGRELAVKAAAEVWRTTATQGIELPQLVPQKVSQRGSANRAAQAGQQEVATGASRWREMERVIKAVSCCFHYGGEPGFL